MKITFETDSFCKALVHSSKVINPKAPSSEMLNVMCNLNPEKKLLTMISINTEVMLKKTVPVTSIEGEPILSWMMSPTAIGNLLREYKENTVTLEINNSDNNLLCILKSGIYKFVKSNESFSLFNVSDDRTEIEVNAPELIDSIITLSEICTIDEMRPVMAGILFHVKPDGLTLVGTDSRRLLCIDLSIGDSFIMNESQLLMHKSIVSILKDIVDKKSAELATICYDDKFITVTSGDSELTCIQIAGRYPAYQSVFPNGNNIVFSLNKDEILAALKRVSVCTEKTKGTIKITVTDGCLKISAQDLNFQISGEETIAIDYSGEYLEIGFKNDSLSSMIKSMPGDKVTIRLGGSKRAALLTVEENPNNIRGIMMPVAQV